MVALTIITANSFAQVQSDIQSATLIHGDQTNVYYGMNAFGVAYDNAVDNDIIVLSPGTFSSEVHVKKSLTIYGSGHATDADSKNASTEVYGTLSIECREQSDDDENLTYEYPTVTLEGLNVSVRISNNAHEAVIRNLKVRKCKGTFFEMGASSENCLISQCVYSRMDTSYSGCRAQQFNIENSWLSGVRGNNSISNNIHFDHCIIYNFEPSQNQSNAIAYYTNCILYASYPTYSTGSNNIKVASYSSTEFVDAEGNWQGLSNADIWADTNEDGNYSDTKTFALKFPQNYIGTDGTEVGINGGNAPFDRISPIPRILAADVDLRTAEDGKLNVSFKVEAQTKE